MIYLEYLYFLEDEFSAVTMMQISVIEDHLRLIGELSLSANQKSIRVTIPATETKAYKIIVNIFFPFS